MSGQPESSGEQVDALARVLMGGGEPCEGATSDARAILATDDPHARAALLATATTDELTAELVKRGVLTEEWTAAGRENDGVEDFEWVAELCAPTRDEAEHYAEIYGGHVERRLVTDWEAV